VGALALRLPGHGGPRRLHRRARLGEALVEEETDAGAGEGEGGIGLDGGLEARERLPVPAEQRVHRAAVARASSEPVVTGTPYAPSTRGMLRGVH
jgi:hypothetical protein